VREKLSEIISALDAVERQGKERDEPEGSRFVVFSDTALRYLADYLRKIMESLK
jgi:hypothetical protein